HQQGHQRLVCLHHTHLAEQRGRVSHYVPLRVTQRINEARNSGSQRNDRIEVRTPLFQRFRSHQVCNERVCTNVSRTLQHQKQRSTVGAQWKRLSELPDDRRSRHFVECRRT